MFPDVPDEYLREAADIPGFWVTSLEDIAELLAARVTSGAVDVSDLLNVLARWGLCECCGADTNSDGSVDVTDLLAVLAAWGSCE